MIYLFTYSNGYFPKCENSSPTSGNSLGGPPCDRGGMVENPLQIVFVAENHGFPDLFVGLPGATVN
jgi:hypothetical protein